MAEPVIKEKIGNGSITVIKSTDVMTGGQNRQRMLYYQLKKSIQRAESIDMIVSFLMESGVKLILEDLRAAIERGIKIRLLTGNYLGITQPSALYLIKKEFGEKIDLRFYNEMERSFHPKSYIFHYENNSEIYIGSSNISRSALTTGIEWNYKFTTDEDEENFHEFYGTFVDLFENHSIVIDDEELKRYADSWHKPAVLKELEHFDEDIHVNIMPLFQPRGAQIEALYALEKSRREGIDKALVQAATGIGKTYIAAFDSLGFSKVLFVAHREEILKQAAIAFRNVRNIDKCGFFCGNIKENNQNVILASVATLGQNDYLNDEYFARDYFDYIVIDEFHHAVNKQYINIMNYFTPKFLLGLTATPERLDGRDVYALCDYNVSYEISLQDSINRGMLVPFHYYGIYDEVDYSNMKYVSGKYLEDDLNRAYIDNSKRNELIYKYYRKYRSKRALGFCCSRKHAENMAKVFSQWNIKAVAVYSDADGEFAEERDQAIKKLQTNEIRVIFSVDMFNEGVDIPEVDMVMFLRPTESPTIFLQQLGRGLRKSKGKEYLNVLDFIGNYKKVEKIPHWLSGSKVKQERNVSVTEELTYPDYCIVDFDTRVIDIFEYLTNRERTIKNDIRDEFYRVKDLLGHVPSRVELFMNMDEEIFIKCRSKKGNNIFKGYLNFLNEISEINVEEKSILDCVAGDFLCLIENTNMTRIYKMPVLLAFYGDARLKMKVSIDEILNEWMKFFTKGRNWQDLPNVDSVKTFEGISRQAHISKIKTMPIKYLKESGNGFFVESNDSVIGLCKELEIYLNNQTFVKHYLDIVEFRKLEYYKRKYDEK